MDALRERLKRPETFAAVFVFVVVSGYLIRPNPTWAFPFYALIVPLTLWHLWRGTRRAPAPAWLRDPALWLCLAAAAWFGLSVAWSVEPRDGYVGKHLGSWFSTSTFLTAGFAFWALAPAHWRERLFRFVPLAAILNAAVSITLHLTVGETPRLGGWAETRHPILGANVMIFAGVLALYQLRPEEARTHRLVALAAIVAVSAFVVMTGSRGPLITWIACTGAFALLAGSRRLLVTAAALGIFATAAAAYALWGPGAEALPGAAGELAAAVERNVNRPSHRLEIWEGALEASAARPVIGYGVGTDAAFSRAYNFPHSLYLSALYYGGAVGLVLVLAVLAYTARRVFLAPDRRTRGLAGALLTLPAVAGLTDLSAIIKGPSELWYILWLPLILIFGLTRRESPA